MRPATARVQRNAGPSRLLCDSCLPEWLTEQGGPLKLDLARFFRLLAPPRDRQQTLEVTALPNDATCPGCGLTFGELASTGLLGCPVCYTAFSSAVIPALQVLRDAPGATG